MRGLLRSHTFPGIWLKGMVLLAAGPALSYILLCHVICSYAVVETRGSIVHLS